MYFAEARFYDASNRTWISRDPAKDGLNWYQYVGSNPTSYWDPTGLALVKVNTNFFSNHGCLSKPMTIVDILKINEQIQDYLKSKGLKDEEIALVYKYPFSALKVDAARTTAETVQTKMFGNVVDGRPGNDFLHAYWNALMAYHIGDVKAELFGTAHETYPDDGTLDIIDDGFSIREHVEMDLFNNAAGREIGANLPYDGREIHKWLLDRYGSQEKINEMTELYGVYGAELVLAIQVMDAHTEGQLTVLANE